MEEWAPVQRLYPRLDVSVAAALIAVCHQDTVRAENVGACHLPHDESDLGADRPIVAACGHRTVSHGTALAIRNTGMRLAQTERGIIASSTTPFTPETHSLWNAWALR
jgi:hypothetical protein